MHKSGRGKIFKILSRFFKKRKEVRKMQYLDDIMYLLGWVCMIIFGFSCGWQYGFLILAMCFFATAVIFARGRPHGGGKRR